MELERPKQKKKKKTKAKVEIETPPTILDNAALANIDIDFPSTSASEDLIPQDQVIEEISAAIQQEEIIEVLPQQEIINEVFDESSTILQNEEEVIEVVFEPSAPTAPLLECPQLFTRVIEPAPQLTFYPNLESLKEMERKTNVKYVSEEILLKPFTKLQLEELYNNVELKLAHQFEKEFIDTELSESFRGHNHILHSLLIKYSKSRHELQVNIMEVDSFKRECDENYCKLWKMMKEVAHCLKVCSDGINVSSKQEYEYAVFQEDVLEDVDKCLKDLLNALCFSYLKNGFDVQILHTQISEVIHRVLESCDEISSISTSDPVTLNGGIKSSLVQPLAEIRLCISILFSFLRKPTPDKKFTTDVQNWIKMLVAIQLRIATWQDHLFLLHHILRCPPGIGNWATSLIQLPKPKIDNNSPFANLEFHHSVALISTLLLPIQQRNKFLEKLNRDLNQSIDPVKEDLWILVDSDGEEGNTPTGECAGLKENDLVALFNQVPFQSIYRLITLLNVKTNDNTFDNDIITAHHLLKSLAFATTFVEILGNGLITYNTEKYKQFAKRLGRLIKHTVFYITDLNEIFKENASTKDPHLLSRIHIELDSFLLRSCNFLYNSQSLGIWQYLSGLPFSNLSIKSIWKLYYCLHIKNFDNVIENSTEDYKSKVLETDFDVKFSIIIEEMPSEDLYYLLQAFSAMALSREESDWDFITTATKNMIMIGFLNEFSKHTCYKTVKDILGNMTTKFPELISYILDKIKTEIQVIGPLLSYLLNSLPFELWHPTWEDLEILAGWLLNYSYESYESTAARIIFSHLNWNFDKDGKLFLPHDIHIRMACLVSEVAAKHVPEVVGSSGISESARQVSHLIKNQTPKVQFTIWCWNMISVLRLHSMDQSKDVIARTLKCPAEVLRQIPDLERTQAIYQGVVDSRPLSLYLSILVSAWGHSVPLICQQGFEQMKLLINDYRHSTVIRCLQLITPLFLECPESLSSCDKFQHILNSILIADRTYMKMAKELITSDGPGPVMEHFCNMIESQLMDYARYGLISPVHIINLWLVCLTEKSNWDKDPQICHILNVIVRFAYQFADAWNLCKNHFYKYYTKIEHIKENKSSSLMSLFSGASQSSILTVPSHETLWLSSLLLDLEFDVFELNTRIWPTLLRQLYFNSSKATVDNVIKKSASLIGSTAFTANNLVVYKLANLILSTPHTHSLFPIICQQFFTLYLARTNLNDGEEMIYGVSDKFYDGNISLMKKLKSHLSNAEHYYKENSMKDDDEVMSPFYDKCAKLCRTFILWLEETNLNQPQIRPVDLPPQYDVNKLLIIYSGNRLHWTEYISLREIRNSQREASDKWLKTCLRYRHSTSLLSASASLSLEDEPKLKIIKRLNSYDDPLPPPIVHREKSLLNLTTLNLQQLKDDCRLLDKYAKSFDNNVNEHRALDCAYKETIRFLYTTSSKQVVRYESCSKHNNCAGAAGLIFSIKESKINNNVKTKINDNRELHNKIINRELAQPENTSFQMSLVLPNVRVQFSINKLLGDYETAKQLRDQNRCEELRKTGVKLFYDFVNGLNEFIQTCPTTQDLYAAIIRKLGIFIKDHHNAEGINLLNIALRRPDMINLLSEIFVPSTTQPASFLAMYQFIVDSHIKRCDTHILFVLLSKFDVYSWLLKFKPKLMNISELIKIIVQGLESWNQENAVLIQGLLRRHLIHIFEYEFPEHYGEILQIVFTGCSNTKLMPDIILDLLNSLYVRVGCAPIEISDNIAKTTDELRNFATKQNALSYKEIVETSAILAKHFQNERLQYGLHGLYPKLNEYCDAISLFLGSIGYSLVVSGVHEYPGILADELVNWLWPSLCEMFSAWLIPYHPQHMKNQPANWIQQMITNNTILLPWSDIHIESAKKLIKMFELCVKFMLDMLPASNLILGHMFCWYEIHFANKAIPKSVLSPIQSHIMTLPWDRFRPMPIHIEGINRILQQFIPESHYFMGHIFLRIPWTPWLQQHIQTWDYATRYKMLASLLMIFIKLSYEPHVREHAKIVTLLQEACNYPWHLLEYQGVEAVLDWFVMSTEPSVVLRMATEHEAIDGAVLDLLQIASAIKFNSGEHITSLHQTQMSQFQAKRILYVRSIVRLLRTCGSKYQQLLSTKTGTQAFHNAVLTLLTVIENVLMKLESVNEKTLESNNLMIEIVCSLQTHNQATSKLFVEAFLIWQSKSLDGSVLLTSAITAIGACKSMSFNLYMLLEATLFNYFRSSGPTKAANWTEVCGKLAMAVTTKDIQLLLQNNFLLSLHVLYVNSVKSIQDEGRRITFIEDLNGQLENYKIIENKEASLILIWGSIIATGCKIFLATGNSKNTLQNIARYLDSFANQTESWSEGILGAIGIKKDLVSTRRRILAKILSNYIFKIINAEDNTMNELNAMMVNKKYTDYRESIRSAIVYIETAKDDENQQVITNLCLILRLFYKEPFLATIESVWNFVM